MKVLISDIMRDGLQNPTDQGPVVLEASDGVPPVGGPGEEGLTLADTLVR